MLFKDRSRRLVCQALRIAGLGIALVAALAVVGPGVPAYAEILAPLRAAGLAIEEIAQENTTTVEFSPTPQPTPTPIATPATGGPLRTQRGGPIEFVFNGALSMGSQLNTNTNNVFAPLGPNPSASPSATPSAFPLSSQSVSRTQSTALAGMQAELSRRTATTLTDLRVPLGVGTNGSGQVVGQVVGLYSTPYYSFGYAPQPLLALGQLPLGSTLRGFEFILPSAKGQETIFEGPTVGAAGETLRLVGVLAQEEVGQNYYEAGFASGSGYVTGAARTIEFGAGTSHGDFDAIGEAAWETRNCTNAAPPNPIEPDFGCANPYGLAVQTRFDLGSLNSGFSATLRSVPNEFVAFGTGQVNGDKFVDLNWHGGSATTIYADANWERTGNEAVGETQQFLETLNLGGQTRAFAYTVGATQQDIDSQSLGVSTSGETSTLQSQIAGMFEGVQSVAGVQLTRAIQAGVPTSIRGLALTFSRTLGVVGGGAVAFQSQRQTQPDLGVTSQIGISPSFFHMIGRKTTLAFSYTVERTISPTSDAFQRVPLFSVTRQISPSIAIDTSLGYQYLHDNLNPTFDGHSRLFTVQLSAPFAFGNGITTGRIDPRLPATIAGRVQVLQSSPSGGTYVGFTNTGSSGGALSNVVVVLDDRYVQRTDLTGGFQFSFIPPGQHQLHVESSSLPRGVTVTTPVVTLDVQGGQTAQVVFEVGNFGGILGHVYGLDANGNQVPLANVRLRVDDGAFSQTDTTGAFGFGGLQSGSHTVEVIENTIPAFAAFAPDELKQTVQVVNGQYATANFKAEPLGSISGKIVYSTDVASEHLVGGVPNAYVVAEPGEHAAIDDEDGSFIIDNLPPGHYTVSVDPETVDGGFGAKPDSIEVDLGPGQHSEGNFFTVGRFEKKVVFSLVNGSAEASAPSVRLGDRRLPPRATTPVTINAPADAKSVTIAVFDQHIALTYDKTRSAWTGEIGVPSGTKAGDYSVDAAVGAGTVPTSATLTVDPKMPLAIVQTTPANPNPGTTVRVRARFLVDVVPGDRIQWEDGQVTTLGKPLTGRVFTFDLRLSLRPLHGTLLTRGSSLPIEIL